MLYLIIPLAEANASIKHTWKWNKNKISLYIHTKNDRKENGMKESKHVYIIHLKKNKNRVSMYVHKKERKKERKK